MKQHETNNAYAKIPSGTVARESHALGLNENEPLIYGMDGMIRYAKAHAMAYGSRLVDDGFLGPRYLAVISGLRDLLNGNGAVAMEKGITTDSKDNGAVEEMFWKAMEIAGFGESDL